MRNSYEAADSDSDDEDEDASSNDEDDQENAESGSHRKCAYCELQFGTVDERNSNERESVCFYKLHEKNGTRPFKKCTRAEAQVLLNNFPAVKLAAAITVATKTKMHSDDEMEVLDVNPAAAITVATKTKVDVDSDDDVEVVGVATKQESLALPAKTASSGTPGKKGVDLFQGYDHPSDSGRFKCRQDHDMHASKSKLCRSNP